MGGNVYQKDALAVHSQTCAQVEYGRAFTDAAFLIRYRDYFCVAIWVPPFHIFREKSMQSHSTSESIS